jgi:hypothetical protein
MSNLHVSTKRVALVRDAIDYYQLQVQRWLPNAQVELSTIVSDESGVRVDAVRIKHEGKVRDYKRYEAEIPAGLDVEAVLVIFTAEEYIQDRLEDSEKMAYNYAKDGCRIAQVLRKLGWYVGEGYENQKDSASGGDSSLQSKRDHNRGNQ